MTLAASTFVSGMDRPVVHRQFLRPMLLAGAVVATGLATAGWLTLNSSQGTLRVDLLKITIATARTRAFPRFHPAARLGRAVG